ncbi:hypothetical protein ACFWXK_13805 [Streptomyces sp. NPDC059070]
MATVHSAGAALAPLSTSQLAEAAAEHDTDPAACTVDEAWAVGKRLASLF